LEAIIAQLKEDGNTTENNAQVPAREHLAANWRRVGIEDGPQPEDGILGEDDEVRNIVDEEGKVAYLYDRAFERSHRSRLEAYHVPHMLEELVWTSQGKHTRTRLLNYRQVVYLPSGLVDELVATFAFDTSSALVLIKMMSKRVLVLLRRVDMPAEYLAAATYYAPLVACAEVIKRNRLLLADRGAEPEYEFSWRRAAKYSFVIVIGIVLLLLLVAVARADARHRALRALCDSSPHMWEMEECKTLDEL
jgi:hypothetical protein